MSRRLSRLLLQPMTLWVLIPLIALAVPFPGPGVIAPAAAQSPCDGLVAPRLTTGSAARVVSTYGLSLKDRPATGAAGAAEVALLPYGTVATVIDGSSCNFGYRWWQFRLPDGRTGWAAEGDSATYFVEPYSVGLHVFRRSEDGTQIAHYVVTPDGRAESRGTLAVLPTTTTPQQMWQQVEIDYLRQALDSVRALCPERLAGTPLDGLTLEQALQLPLPPLEYDLYPAPDGDQLLLVRHYHLLVPRCDTVVPDRVGISVVSVLLSDGQELDQFPFPQHGSVPASEDGYAPGEPDTWAVSLDEVVWSPDETAVAIVAAYRDRCSSATCYRFHFYVLDRRTGALYVPGEGRHVGWGSGGTLSFFRWVYDSDGQQRAHLYTIRYDGQNRQEVWLPGGAVYMSGARQELDYPWDASGTRVMVGNAGADEVMLFNLNDRTFTIPVSVPDLAPAPNRLAVRLIRGGTAFLWVTIRGNFVVQNARTGDWTRLSSDLSVTGVAPRQVRTFEGADAALIEMVDGSAYVLDLAADTLIPVVFGP